MQCICRYGVRLLRWIVGPGRAAAHSFIDIIRTVEAAAACVVTDEKSDSVGGKTSLECCGEFRRLLMFRGLSGRRDKLRVDARSFCVMLCRMWLVWLMELWMRNRNIEH